MRIHAESHLVERIGWLRAAVLGANDGIVSTASLIVGVAAADVATHNVLVTGVAGLVAGAMSMAAGEYVSVSTQADTERADLARETLELANQPEQEYEELVRIYQQRGLTRELAEQVATQMTAHDALTTHLRDELGMSGHLAARPVQAAVASAGAFAVGAALPLALVPLVPAAYLTASVSAAALAFLALLGGLGAWMGGAPVMRAIVRVTFWGALAMAATAGIGRLFGTQIA